MELTLSAIATATTGLSKTLIYSTTTNAQIPRSQLAPVLHFQRPKSEFRLACVSSSAASFASGGGGVGRGLNGGGGGGGGGHGGDGGEVKVDPIAVGVDDVLYDVIILDVRGMSCGGCSAKVKRILESQPLVSAASVNLKAETAIVWPVPAAKVTPNWQTVLGEELAKHLTTCGFNSNIKGEAATEEEAS